MSRWTVGAWIVATVSWSAVASAQAPPASLTANLRAVGSVHDEFFHPTDGWWQTVDISIDHSIDVTAVNPVVSGDTVTYQVTQVAGTLQFSGEAVDFFDLMTTILGLDENRIISGAVLSGTIEYSLSECRILSLDVDLIPSGSTDPETDSISFSASSGTSLVSVPLPFPWNIGAVTNVFEVAGSAIDPAGVCTACRGDLLEYRLSGTQCVYRRTEPLTFQFDVPIDATNVELVVTGIAPEFPPAVHVDAGRATATFTVAAPAPLGAYQVAARWDIGSSTFTSAANDFYLIFEPPVSLGNTELRTFLYDERAHEDTRAYRIGRAPIPPGASRYIHIGPDPLTPQWRTRHWEERDFLLDPFDEAFFDKVIRAVAAQTDPAATATQLMNAISNLIEYDAVNREASVPKILAPVSSAEFQAAFMGTESPEVMGQCLDYAASLAAAHRTIGIPARVATKIFGPGDFAYHQWTEAHVGGAWHAFDAMDYPSDAAGPIGDDPTSSFAFGPGAFEIVVGSQSWALDGGLFEIVETQPAPARRVGLRAQGPTGPTSDALFEKCGGNPIGHVGGRYPTDDCPDLASPELQPLALSFDQTSYRTGDTVTATVSLINPNPTAESVDVTVRFGAVDPNDDWRDAFGDPVAEAPGSGVLGVTLDEFTETVVVPAFGTLNHDEVLLLTPDLDPADSYFVEASTTGPAGPSSVIEDFAVAPGYDVFFSISTPAPMVGDSIGVDLIVSNEVGFDLTDVVVSLVLPDEMSTSSGTTATIASLPVGFSALAQWVVDPNTSGTPARLQFAADLSTTNGGVSSEVRHLQLGRPPTPRIRLATGSHQAVEGESLPFAFEIENLGDSPLTGLDATLALSAGLANPGSTTQQLRDLAPGESTTALWTVLAAAEGVHRLELDVSAAGGEQDRYDFAIAVPEPGRWVSLMAGAVLLAFLQRIRRRSRSTR